MKLLQSTAGKLRKNLNKINLDSFYLWVKEIKKQDKILLVKIVCSKYDEFIPYVDHGQHYQVNIFLMYTPLLDDCSKIAIYINITSVSKLIITIISKIIFYIYTADSLLKITTIYLSVL